MAVAEYWIHRSGLEEAFSEQNLIDCDKTCLGCRGGWPTNAFNYMKVHGISDESKYVYRAASNPKCLRIPRRWPPILKVPNACEVDIGGNEETMKRIIAQVGPVAGVMTVTDTFASYDSGVFYDQSCVNGTANHAIVSENLKSLIVI